ncbi:MAG TPA: FxSxx-COOH system tetratricopeptide repeat protein [Candidatus Binatia bacterium]|nr:FxSxx-COOH system tetratricopeptide repeat protein [Candidatus Binatia bacterium]
MRCPTAVENRSAKPLAGPPEEAAPGAAGSTEALWNIPYARNPFFTGREKVLEQLHAALTSNGTAALSGLGGIGKTQTAIEYAYRHREDCKAVLWAKADSRDAILSGFVALAGSLNLPEKDAQDQNLAVAAVKRWLETNTEWLLILDNADDLTMAREFIPTGRKGHVLLTTRAQAMGTIAQRLEIEEMQPEEGALFLLRRAKILTENATLDAASAADRAQAEEISKELDGLPLALDQAGAYIEETACGLSDYLGLYRAHGAKLLKRRGAMVSDHQDPVATTWALSFEKVEKVSPAAAELLRFCAFLSPDAIPEDLITEGAPELGPVLEPVAADPFELNTAIAEILKYSLLHRNPTAKTLDIHRLVQAVLKDEMNGVTQRLWAERAVRAVNRTFPNIEFSTWQRCEQFLPHAQACAELIEKWGLEFPEAARLLNQAGFYLYERARYAKAEPRFQRALAIWEKVLGPAHPDVALSLNNLAELYRSQGKYAEAEPRYQRALAIWEKALGPAHPNVATVLENYAFLLRQTKRDAEAAKMAARATAIRAKHAQENPPK